jgi:hypothetical protein
VVSTDLHVSGKVAQFGRGVMGDVSSKLMAQFANNLNTMLDSEQDDPQEAAALVEEAVAHAQEVAAHIAEAPAAAAAPTASAPGEPPQVRKIQGPAAEPIELSEFAGSAVLKRLLPALGGLIVVLLILRRLRK